MPLLAGLPSGGGEDQREPTDDRPEAEARGDAAAAAAAYRRALEAQPGHPEARAALGRIELSQRSRSLDGSELRSRLAAHPDDVDAAMGLADVLAASGDPGGAFDLLVGVVSATGGDERDRARLHLLRLLDTVPADDQRALAARRALSRALF